MKMEIRKGNPVLVRGYTQLLLRILILLITGLIIFSQILLIMPQKGMEMFPAVKDGDLLLATRLGNDYHKDDVVIYKQNDKKHVGRIIACEGDIVSIDENGNLHVNGTLQSGEILFPTYANETLSYPYTVPDKQFFILGDYRTEASDSRDYGAVSKKQIKGKVITLMRRRGL